MFAAATRNNYAHVRGVTTKLASTSSHMAEHDNIDCKQTWQSKSDQRQRIWPSAVNQVDAINLMTPFKKYASPWSQRVRGKFANNKTF